MNDWTIGRTPEIPRPSVHPSTRPLVHAGIVLAAGASSRMGQPKALLEAPSGQPLARVQCDLLKSAGCERVVVVLGCDAKKIEARLQGCEWVINDRWPAGRLSSAQCGLRACPGFDGYIILPVDTAGVRTETIRLMLNRPGCYAIRPIYQGQHGRVAWISRAAAGIVLAVADPSQRLDEIMAGREAHVAVDDPAIVNNINTPDDWTRWLEKTGRS